MAAPTIDRETQRQHTLVVEQALEARDDALRHTHEVLSSSVRPRRLRLLGDADRLIARAAARLEEAATDLAEEI